MKITTKELENHYKELSKMIYSFCVRNNTSLEGLHDRISDEEMKELNKGSVNNIYTFLRVFFGLEGDSDKDLFLRYLLNSHKEAEWDEPVSDWSEKREAIQNIMSALDT